MEPQHVENAPANDVVAPPPGNTNNVEEDVLPQHPLGASRRLKSDVWPHFTRMMVSRVLKAKCNYCKKVLDGKSSNVSASEVKALEGMFSAMAMDDVTIEESTDGAEVPSQMGGDEDDHVVNLVDKLSSSRFVTALLTFPY
ncbi:unnamed protein product [Linum trigynum]|uniref:BED-type domain-containing protein n=1 Tax=Linum trigynum TaxID=586398 RepID=A0AAV2ENQ8_9ROSI